MDTVCSLAIVLGGAIWMAGFIGSIVLAKRMSIFWLWGLVALWLAVYPFFVAINWGVAKRNFAWVSMGISLFVLGLYFMPSTVHQYQ